MTNTDRESVPATDTTYTLTPEASVLLGRLVYAVEVQRMTNGSILVWLTGPRGASYFLREMLLGGKDDGMRQVISFKSGQPLRVRGNEVRVIHIGDTIEVVR